MLGVDLGGTNVRARAYREDGSPSGDKFEIASNAREGVDAVVRSIVQVVRSARASSDLAIDAVGIAVPGHILDETGTVVWAPNFGEELNGVFRYWESVPLRGLLSPRVEGRIRLGNDANLAALGEYKFGSGKGTAKCLVMFTIGTGIGSGVVLGDAAVLGDARGPLVVVGSNGGAVELGHVAVQAGGLDCNSGEYGSLEAYCQRDSIVRRAVHRLRRGRRSMLAEMADDWADLTPKDLSVAAEKGDDLAIEVWTEVGTYLGIGIATAINTFAPDVVAIGGQIAKAGEWLLAPARKSARDFAIPSLFADARIVQAERIDDAGMIGGAALALEPARWT